MKTKFNGILTLLLALFVQMSFAQEKTISGVVSDSTGPLPGVSVLKKGTTQGTETDFDGNYTLNAKAGDVLVFSFVGMETVELVVAASSRISVTMKEDNVLEEVIVVGYSTSKKESQVGSSKQVKAVTIQSKATSNITKALAGEVSGVNVQNNSGQPGSSAKVRIRGFSSLGGANSPLYVVDGVPFEGNLNELNQSDMESFTVLKDASATAIYGSRGSNGVVVITTKKGKKGSSSIEIDSKSGISLELIPRYDMVDDIDQTTELMWGIMKAQALAIDPTMSDLQAGQYASKYLFSDNPNSGAIPNFYNLYRNSGEALIDPSTGKIKNGDRRYAPESWDDNLFGLGMRYENTVKLSGGNDKLQYYTSLGALDDNGYAKNTDFKRITARANLNYEVKEWLKGATNMTFVDSKTRGAAGVTGRYSVNSFFFAKNVPSIYPVYQRDKSGNKIAEPYFGGYLYDVGSGVDENGDPRPDRLIGNDNSPLVATEYNYNANENKKFTVNQYLEANLAKGLKAASRFGYEYLDGGSISRVNPFYGPGVNDKGTIERSITRMTFATWTKMLMYNFELGEHKFDILAAHENSDFTIHSMSAQKKRLVNPFSNDLDNALTDMPSYSSTNGYALESYFGKLKYDFSEKYLASLTFRRDGSSKFSRDKWDNFGAVGLGWNIHKEDFLMDSKIIKKLKLRSSYGLTGSQGTATSGFRQYYANQELFSVDNLSGDPTLVVNSKGNPDLTWETAKMLQVGLDFNIADKVEASIDYYTKNTQNMFYNQKGGVSLGYSSIKVNDGEMRNSGLEFDLKYYAIDNNDFKLNFSVNGEMVANKIISMPIDPATNKPTIFNSDFDISQGRSYYDIFTVEWAGVDKNTGEAQWIAHYDDKNNNGIMDENEGIKNMVLFKADKANKDANIKETKTKKYQEGTRKYLDKLAVSTVRGSFGVNLEYKGLSFSSQFMYGIGGYVYDTEYASYMSDGKVGSKKYHKDVLNRWSKENKNSDIPRFTGGVDNNANSNSSRFLTKRDFLTLNNIKVGYSFPESFLEGSGVSKLSLYLAGDNLWVGSARKGLNPSTSTSSVGYSPLSTFTLGLNVKF